MDIVSVPYSVAALLIGLVQQVRHLVLHLVWQIP